METIKADCYWRQTMNRASGRFRAILLAPIISGGQRLLMHSMIGEVKQTNDYRYTWTRYIVALPPIGWSNQYMQGTCLTEATAKACVEAGFSE